MGISLQFSSTKDRTKTKRKMKFVAVCMLSIIVIQVVHLERLKVVAPPPFEQHNDARSEPLDKEDASQDQLKESFQMEKEAMKLMFKGMKEESFQMEKEAMKLMFKGMKVEMDQIEELKDALQAMKQKVGAMTKSIKKLKKKLNAKV